jgi:type IV pilus assembly protein PilE
MGNAVGGNTTNATPLASFYPDEAPLAGNAKFYNLRFTYTSTAYTVFAVPKGAQAGNGNVRLLNTGSRAWDKADDGSYSYDW